MKKSSDAIMGEILSRLNYIEDANDAGMDIRVDLQNLLYKIEEYGMAKLYEATNGF